MGFTNLEFTADFPDDRIEQGEGDECEIVSPSGMAMALAVRELLTGAGILVTEPEADIEHYCWVMGVGKGPKNVFWVRVYDLGEGEKIIGVEGASPFLKHLFGRQDHYMELLEILDRLLTDDPRFGPIQWTDLNRIPIARRGG